MNNKEAIDILNLVNRQAKNQPHEFYEALDLAIKALEDDHRCNDMSRLYVLDKIDGRIHRIGDECHDSLCVMGGEIHYHNLQNGDGGTIEDKEGCGYVILKTMDGCIGSKELAAHGYAPDERFIEPIEKYISEQENNNG